MPHNFAEKSLDEALSLGLLLREGASIKGVLAELLEALEPPDLAVLATRINEVTNIDKNTLELLHYMSKLITTSEQNSH